MTYVVAIDGPAAAGKSTTARLVALRLGIMHLNTGAMYRAVTLACQEQDVAPAETPELMALLDDLDIQLRSTEAGSQAFLNGRDVTRAIQTPEVSQRVSAYSSLAPVRRRLVSLQRGIGEHHSVVCEGRDIGTIVFPDAQFKFYLEASLEIRARRRLGELRAQGLQPSQETVVEELQARDRQDSTRELSPLRRAPDAMVIDTSRMTIEAQVEAIAAHVENAQRSGKAQNNYKDEAQHD